MNTKLILFFIFLSTNMLAQTLSIEDKVKFLALGDSYTIGQSVVTTYRWPVQLIDSLKKRGLGCYDPKIIATTGWRTDNLKAAIVNAKLKNEYTLVSLLIGVNNYYQGYSVDSYKPEFEELLNMAVTLAGGIKSHVFVVSIPDYGYTPYGKSNQPTISKGIDDFNAANKMIAAKLGISYFNITDISRRGLSEPTLVASDGLHPSGMMYTEWIERILEGSMIAEGHGSIDPPVVDPPVVDPPVTPVDTTTITGIKDERYGIQVYPNPFHDQVVVKGIPKTEQLTLQVLDSQGSIVFAKKVNSESNDAKLSHLACGAYYYKLASTNGVVKTGRLIKTWP